MLARPAADANTIGGLALPGGDYAVVLLKVVREDEQADSDSESASTRQSQDYGAREMEAAFEAMEAAADVRIERDNFENL